jgi:hypothetical protein
VERNLAIEQYKEASKGFFTDSMLIAIFFCNKESGLNLGVKQRIALHE